MVDIDNTSLLIWGMVFSSIGLGFFIYGKRQKAVVPLMVGIALFIFSYFMPNVYALVFTGTVLIALPYFVKI